MTIIKTKTKKGYGTVTLEYETWKDAQKLGITYTGYVVKNNGEIVSSMRSNKKDAMKSFKYECERTFGRQDIEKVPTSRGRGMPRLI